MLKLGLLLTLLSCNVYADYVAHEWGTFTSLMGSDGTRQNGMYHEDELLPSFVYRFGEDYRVRADLKNLVADHHGCGRNRKACDEYVRGKEITQKMETPVLYFYSKTNEKITVDIGFPNGIIAESYPKYDLMIPEANPGVELKNGRVQYKIEILTDNNAPIPYVERNNIYYHARNVESNIIKNSIGELEKFIFYRGIGDFTTDLAVTSDDKNIYIENNGDFIKHVFILNSKKQKGSIHALGGIKKGKLNRMIFSVNRAEELIHKPNVNFIKESRQMLIKALTSEGLKRDEASAMINTWEHSYLKTDGLRILYVLHPNEVERILPMKLSPSPSELERVFIGRIEVLTFDEERKLINQVLHTKGGFKAETLGRMAHPIANRLLEIAKNSMFTSKQIQKFERLKQDAIKL